MRVIFRTQWPTVVSRSEVDLRNGAFSEKILRLKTDSRYPLSRWYRLWNEQTFEERVEAATDKPSTVLKFKVQRVLFRKTHRAYALHRTDNGTKTMTW